MHDPTTEIDRFQAMALQADGKLVAVGYKGADPSAWLKLSWFDLYSGREFEVRVGDDLGSSGAAVLKTYREVLDSYRVHPEAKSLGPDEWRPALERAGLDPGLRIHDLRHTSVALAIAAGAHPKEIQELCGHASIGTTLNVYGHLLEGLQDRLAERLADTFRASRAAWMRA